MLKHANCAHKAPKKGSLLFAASGIKLGSLLSEIRIKRINLSRSLSLSRFSVIAPAADGSILAVCLASELIQAALLQVLAGESKCNQPESKVGGRVWI